MKTSPLYKAGLSLSLVALLTLPTTAALASEDAAAVGTSVSSETAAETTGAAEPFAAAAAVSAIDLRVALGPGLLAQLPLTLDTAAYRMQAIQDIKDIRGKAWDDPTLPFQPSWGSKGPMSLQQYLRSIGITSKKQYQDMVAWDADLERSALQRLYETNVYWSHDRTNGSDASTATNGAISTFGENLYSANGPAAAMKAWTTQPSPLRNNMSEWDWLKKEQGKFGFNQGHLWNILSPTNRSFALVAAGSSTNLAMSTEKAKNQRAVNYKGTYTGQITLDPKYLSSYAISSAKTMSRGQTEQATVAATQYLTPSWTNYYLKPTTLVGTWSSSNTSVLRVDSSGKITAVGNGSATIRFTPALLDANGARKAASTTLTQTITVNSQRFRDVDPSNQFFKEIEWMAERGITTGYSDRTYRPLEPVERGAMAAFFYRMAGSPNYTPPAVSRFKDVPTSHQFYKEISWMADQKITTGWADGTFRPHDSVNRDAMAAFFHRFSNPGWREVPMRNVFTDVSPSTQFASDILWMSRSGITTGYPDGSYRPTAPVNRDAMAAFFYRYAQKYGK